MNKFDVTEFLLFFYFFPFSVGKKLFLNIKWTYVCLWNYLDGRILHLIFKKIHWGGARPQTPLAVLSHVAALTGLPNIHMWVCRGQLKTSHTNVGHHDLTVTYYFCLNDFDIFAITYICPFWIPLNDFLLAKLKYCS